MFHVSLGLFIGGKQVSQSPIKIRHLAFLLKSHPNKNLSQYVINGFRRGFDIGFRGVNSPGADYNCLSAHQNPNEVERAIDKEVSRGHTVGPFDSPPLPNFHI